MLKILSPFAFAFTFTFALHLAATAAIPVRWTVDTFRVNPLVYDCYHGETLDLAAALTAYGDPINLSGKTARLYWQTNGMDSAYWSTNATIASAASVTNILAATFSGAYDTGAPSVSGFIGVEGENYRAAFTLNFRPSPGFAPAHLPLPTRVLDFATTAVANPDASPFMVKGGSGGIDALTATNISRTVTSNIVTKTYVESLGISGGGITTNDVNSIIASSNLVDVAAATAMTNALRGKLDLAVYELGVVPEGPWTWSGENAELVAALNASNAIPVCVYDQYHERYEWSVPGGYTYAGWTIQEGGPETPDTPIVYFAAEEFELGEITEVVARRPNNKVRRTGNRLATTNDVRASVSISTNSAKAYVDNNFAPKLTGHTYDFANGSNFVKRVYEALTNVIQSLGGSVTNAPAFN